MTIETQYNIGDDVWVTVNHKARHGQIVGISAGIAFNHHAGKCVTTIRYTIDTGWGCEDVKEEYVFAAKEDLIASL